MKIMVTGGSGVIGQSLVPKLRQNHEVLTFDIREELWMDIKDFASVSKVMEKGKPEICIHMAAQVGRLTGENFPQMSVDSNVLGTLNVVKACLQNGVRLINFSTSEVFGHNSVYGKPDILSQNGMYGITKLAAEAVVKHFCDTYSLRAVSVRPFMVYGPHETPNGEFRSAISNFLDTAMKGGTIHAHAGCVRSWCYVEDFVEGMSILLNYEPTGYEAFCIGTEEYRSMEDAAQVCINTVGKGNYVVEEIPQFFVSAVKKADFSKMKSLGFDPKINLEEGVKRTYKWMRER